MKRVVAAVLVAAIAIYGVWRISRGAGGDVRAIQTIESKSQVLKLTNQDNGASFSVPKGEEIELRLAENAGSTGYSWELAPPDANLFDFVGKESVYPQRPVGSGGEAVFRFRAVGAGAGDLALKMWRPWEGDASVKNRFSAHFEIRP
ncbi:protease inhibitor I42 family protein [Rhodoblastus sp.]|uniref:protease inhibitor I42 family protein n=1 Tax=Rhodoblastus sp. TaxID=1962975 RepID=UPI003F98464A